jgi:N-dimethylarginine dimethylaminohydrolase
LTHIGDTDTETKPGRKDLMPISRTPHNFSSNALRNWAADAPVIKPVEWGVDSEVGRLREITLCAPDYWGIDKNANAVVKAAVARGVEFDVETAKRQHRNFVSALQREGIAVRWLPLLKSQISQTYTRDSSFMTPWGVVVCRMQAECRRGEYAAVMEFCRQHNVPIWRTITDGTVEGGDVHVAKPGKLLIGYSEVRTTRNGAMQVLDWFAEKGWAGKLVQIDPNFLHLDLLFCMVDIDTAVICTDGFTKETFDEIVNFLEIKNVIRASYTQAMKLLCNVLALGNRKVIIHQDGDNVDLVRQLEKYGYEALQVDLSSFTSDGGGPHCLAMSYRRDFLGVSRA